ncbi:hypothetical protein KL907_002824 [Ogataea polymorpha]|nr:hypothetical protein KL907_002824 [Ogataea polymorpha]
MTSSKLTGRQLYDKLGRPKKVVAPMVDGSELAWRMISRNYGADLCYSPMLHSRLFATDDKYREKMFGPMDGSEADRPLIVQFCANDPDFLLQAAKHVEDRCDAVDLNLGCPQGIARKGHYGSFLMEDWDLISKLINTLHRNLKIPVTAKIRVYDDWDKSLAYAKMCLDAGAQFLTVHGRTREMKGQKTGFANWKLVKYIKDNLPPERTVFLSNGNILYPDDIDRCIKEVGCDAVMSAEGNLYNPGIFWTETEDIEKQFPRIDRFVREYFDVVARCEGSESRRCFKSHLFKSLRNFLSIHTDVRAEIAKLSRNSPLEEFEAVVKMIEDVVAKIYQQDNIAELDQVRVGEVETWGGRYREVPYWRLQPYFRRVDGKDGREVIQDSMKRVMESEEAVKRQKLEGVK